MYELNVSDGVLKTQKRFKTIEELTDYIDHHDLPVLCPASINVLLDECVIDCRTYTGDTLTITYDFELTPGEDDE